MANRPTLPCRQPGCSELIPGGGFCEAHKRPTWNKEHTMPIAWTTTHRRILKRDPICNICHKAKATTVDHIVPRSEGGTDDDSNLAGACQPCHDRKSQAEANRGRLKSRGGVILPTHMPILEQPESGDRTHALP